MQMHGTDPLKGLNEAQRQAVEATEGPVLVLAGAGSGKTRVLAHRIAHIVQQGKAKPWQVLAVTFTNKAAQELRERVARITPGGDEVAAGTFHATMLRVLRREADAIGFPKDFTIFDTDDSRRLIKIILNEYGEDRFRSRTIHTIISRAKNDLIDPDAYESTATMPIEKLAAKVYHEYQRRIKLHAAMDFDDLLIRPLELFRSNPTVLLKWSQRWRYLHVDEYQDTNLAQFELLRVLAGPKPNLFAVGDDDQSIYGWRGARVENIFRFRDAFPGSQVFRLEQNYRSTQKILDLAHAVVSRSVRREEKKLWTEKQGGSTPKIVGVPSDQDEAREIADLIGREVLAGSRAFKDFAVLYRTNAQSRLLEDVFRGRRYPFQVVGAVSFYERKEVRDALAYFKLCLNERDDLSLRRIISEPPRGIGANTLEKLIHWAKEHDAPLMRALADVGKIDGVAKRSAAACVKFSKQLVQWKSELENLPLEQWASHVLEESGYLPRLREEKSFESQGRIDNLEAFVDSLAEFASDGGSLGEYIEQAALATDQDKYDPGSDTIRLMTVHAAKGLEFPVVIVSGLESTLFPLAGEDRETDTDEERRLFYVAVTRAREDLVLTYANLRRVWGQMDTREPSIFLREIPEEAVNWKTRGVAMLDTSVAGSRRRSGRSSDDPSSRSIHGERSGEYDPWAARRKNRSAVDAEDESGSSTTRSPAPMQDEDVPAVRVGDLVEHPTFGQGIVLATSKWRNDIKVQVEFEGRGVMSLMQRIARLHPVRDFR
ncbi:MAG: UvrD-helicase domain-containing protein [bacterium]